MTEGKENEDHGMWSHHYMGNRWGNSGNSVDFILRGPKITVDGDCSHEIKRHLLLGRKVMTQRRYFANKCPSSQGCFFQWSCMDASVGL